MMQASRTLVWMLKGLALVIALSLLILAGLAVWAVQRHDIRLVSVMSGSMEPEIATGDAVLIGKTNTDSLVTGDVVSYRTTELGPLTTHRIHQMIPEANQLVTKGDANSEPDGVLAESQIAGKAIAIAPYAGSVARLLQSPIGLIAFIYLPATVIVLYEARQLQINLRRPYRLQR